MVSWLPDDSYSSCGTFRQPRGACAFRPGCGQMDSQVDLKGCFFGLYPFTHLPPGVLIVNGICGDRRRRNIARVAMAQDAPSRVVPPKY
ncbi:unnamed protein product, partial [Protopolystoma xenopodis]